MYKSFITLAVTLAVTTPAMAQQYNFPSKSQRAEMAAAQAAGSAAQATVSRDQYQSTATASSFREPTGHTREQLLFAVDMQREAVRMCRKGNTSAELSRSLAEAGGNIATILVEKALKRNSFGFGRGYRGRDNGDSSQDCDDLGRQVYADALEVVPESYCDESMTSEYRRGGQAVAEERMVRRCQARKADSSWSARFQPKD